MSIKNLLIEMKNMSELMVDLAYSAVLFNSKAAAEEVVAEGPKEVSVFLKSVGASKIPVIKAVQAITGLGLLEAKKLCDALPAPIKEKIRVEIIIVPSPIIAPLINPSLPRMLIKQLKNIAKSFASQKIISTFAR